jgi:REP element-mobilizing transposase RayT
MILNDLGQIADTEWKNTVNIRPNIILDTYIIMPNHMHGIIIIDYQIKPSKKITIPHPIIPNEKIFPHIDPHHSYNCRDKLQFVSTKNIFTGEDVSTLKTPKLTPSKQHRKPPYGTSQTIGAIVRGFKIGVTTHARKTTNIVDVWQPNYYDRVIRNKNELIRIREYISHNPLKWESDKNNLENIWL